MMSSPRLDFSKLDLMDSLDLAIQIEREAEERYHEFARMIGSSRPDDAGSFFAGMAENERKHGEQLRERRRKLFGDRPSRINPDILDDVEAPEYDKPRAFMSARHALDVAMASEIKAQMFFEAGLAAVKDAEVKTLFKELRDEEIEHQRLLRLQIERTDPSLAPERANDEIEEPPGL